MRVRKRPLDQHDAPPPGVNTPDLFPKRCPSVSHDLHVPARPISPASPGTHVCKGYCTLYTWTSGTQGSVSSARRAFRHALDRAGLSREAVSNAVLAASELAANATEHAAGPYMMTLRHTGTELICEIHDRDPQIPAFPAAAPLVSGQDAPGGAWGELYEDLSERGRGLHIVDQLTAGKWGFRRSGDGGKIAWMAILLAVPSPSQPHRSARDNSE
ncbi:ATP-binding protein [Streptomyces sp. NPDC058409]|uniref:ATP-binding protein n=1 Tax=Streptomyces sp. NPDC058409 TaxID=3346484 RepID=UPI0036698F61